MAVELKCTRCGGPAVRLLQTDQLDCANQCTETAVSMARRVVLQEEVVTIADVIKAKLPNGVGFTLLLFDFGNSGNMAYVSTAEREGAVALLQELLDKMRVAPSKDTVPR